MTWRTRRRRSRAEPEIIIHSGRRITVGSLINVAHPILIGPRAHHANFAKRAALHIIEGVFVMRCAALLCAHLHDAIVLPRKAVIAKTNHMYKPGTRRPYGVLEWPAMRRLADRIDPSYKQ